MMERVTDGTWTGGTWPDATWLDATWLDAAWPDATWPDAAWLDGTARNERVTGAGRKLKEKAWATSGWECPRQWAGRHRALDRDVCRAVDVEHAKKDVEGKNPIPIPTKYGDRRAQMGRGHWALFLPCPCFVSTTREEGFEAPEERLRPKPHWRRQRTEKSQRRWCLSRSS